MCMDIHPFQTTGRSGKRREVRACMGMGMGMGTGISLAWPKWYCTSIPHLNTSLSSNKDYTYYRSICESSRKSEKVPWARETAWMLRVPLRTYTRTTLAHTPAPHLRRPQVPFPGLEWFGTRAPRLAGIWLTNSPSFPPLAQPYQGKLCSHQMRGAMPHISVLPTAHRDRLWKLIVQLLYCYFYCINTA
jgi:hypothetical protein